MEDYVWNQLDTHLVFSTVLPELTQKLGGHLDILITNKKNMSTSKSNRLSAHDGNNFERFQA